MPSLTLCLLYPDEAGCSSPRFAPRLVTEVVDLSLAAEVGRAGGAWAQASLPWLEVPAGRRGWRRVRSANKH